MGIVYFSFVSPGRSGNFYYHLVSCITKTEQTLTYKLHIVGTVSRGLCVGLSLIKIPLKRDASGPEGIA